MKFNLALINLILGFSTITHAGPADRVFMNEQQAREAFSTSTVLEATVVPRMRNEAAGFGEITEVTLDLQSGTLKMTYSPDVSGAEAGDLEDESVPNQVISDIRSGRARISRNYSRCNVRFSGILGLISCQYDGTTMANANDSLNSILSQRDDESAHPVEHFVIEPFRDGTRVGMNISAHNSTNLEAVMSDGISDWGTEFPVYFSGLKKN